MANDMIPNDPKPVRIKGKRNRPDLANFGQENVQPGDNARYLRHALDKWNLPPIDIADDKQVEQRLKWYFENCAENDIKPTVLGLSSAIGVDRRTLRAWYSGETRAITHSPLIKKAYTLLEELWEDYMLNGKVNPASGIFLGKNHFGYQDQQDYVVRPGQMLSEQTSPEQMLKQIEALPDD